MDVRTVLEKLGLNFECEEDINIALKDLSKIIEGKKIEKDIKGLPPLNFIDSYNQAIDDILKEFK